MILEIFSCGPIETNTYLIACDKTKRAAIIDTPYDSFELLRDRLKELSLSLEMVLFTHSHWDHTAEAALFKKEFHVPLWVHADDAGNLENPGSDRLPLLGAIEGVKPDHYLKEGESISLGEIEIRVIHTPGHTPGGVCFYVPSEHVLFSGDTLFRGTIGNISFPTARPALMWESLKKLAQLPANTKVFPGHGEPTTIGEESWLARAQQKYGG
jgi:glyoxylase-like metal-dependent hydrolase (beta-lactamase superfamily II)